MALADFDRCKQRFISILMANRLAYSNVVGTANAGISAWQYNQEIADILLDADSIVITQGYFQSEQSLRNRFMTQSANLANGAKLPEFEGIVGKCEFSLSGSAWNPSQEAKNKQDVVGMARLGTAYLGANPTAGHHFFEEGYVYHTSPFFRLEYPTYAKTTALQALVNHEPGIVCAALGLAYKETNVHAAEWYDKKGETLLERIRQGSMRMRSMMPGPLPQQLRG